MVAELNREALEAEIGRTISRFHEDQHGCRSERTVAYVVGDMIVVRSSGCFTTTEKNLSHSEDGRRLTKSARRELRSLTRRQVEAQVAQLVGIPVLRSYWDLDVRIGEQVEVYVLAQDFSEKRA